MPKLIFDFDGVIGDTYEAVIYGLLKTGREKTTESAVENMNEYVSKRPYHANGHTLTDKELANEYTWTSSFGNYVHEHGFSLFEDFVKEIEKINTKHIAIVSSGSQNYVLPAVAKTNIRPTHILAFENHHSKEEKVAMVCKDWGVDTKEVYYFTDTLADVYELKDILAKDKLIGVTWGYCSKEQLLTELREERILDTASDIHKIVS